MQHSSQRKLKEEVCMDAAQPDEYQVLFLRQEGGCAICQRKNVLLRIDYDAHSKKPRGLLCARCRLAVYHLQDHPTLQDHPSFAEQVRAYLGKDSESPGSST